MTDSYFPRSLDNMLKFYLEAFGAVVIKGPKWCGKTTTAQKQAKSILKMQDLDNSAAYLEMADFMPSRLLKGDTPRLIDEWQMAPVLWDAVRNAVDQRQKPGQFILTGSTVVDRSKIMHSGTGRIAQLDMYPMSLFESKESNGSVSLSSLFENEPFSGASSQLSVEELVFALCQGGWPDTLKIDKDLVLLVAQAYFDSIINDDVSSSENGSYNPNLTRAILQSYA